MTDEDRRAFENLILLCLPHAEEVDLKALADRYPAETVHQWKSVQLQAAPPEPPNLPEGLLERAVVLSMGDVLMDFREATIDLGGKPATAPGAGGSGGGAIGPGARGGDGGPGGGHYEFTVTGAQVLGEIPIEVGHGGRGGVDACPVKPEGIHALALSSFPAVAARRIRDIEERAVGRAFHYAASRRCGVMGRSTGL